MAPEFGWFDEARFGMFIHWGQISRRGLELSWPLVGGAGDLLPFATACDVDDYYRGALAWSPEPGAPKEWCRRAREAGMGYAVLTTKHHEGFALWPTAKTDFSIGQTPYAGDLVGEYVEAARAEGLRVGFYYSLSDWHHPDYPAFRDEDKPYFTRFLGRRAPADAWARYLDVLFGQIEELLTGYGPIDLLWFDGGWERHRDEWQVARLDELIRSLQPDIIVNDRLPGHGDYDTPEQAVPASPPERRWETCLTMNRTWGFCPGDQEYKSARSLVHTLCETAGRGGNLLLNVSPDGRGALPEPQLERLEAIGGWMAAHRDAILGTQPGLAPWQFYGPSTRKGDRVFLHLTMRPYDTVGARGLPVRRLVSVRNLATGTELDWEPRLSAGDQLTPGDGVLGEAVIRVPEAELDWAATVIELQFAS